MPEMNCRNRLTRLAGVIVLLAACGGEEPIGPDEFHRVGGYYSGPIVGETYEGDFSGAIWIDLVQSEGALIPGDCPGRAMEYEGTYDDGPSQIRITGSLLLTTSLCNPLVSIPHSTILQRN